MTANSYVRFGPLAAMALVHAAAALAAAPSTGSDERIEYLVWFVLFPVQFSLIAVWLAVQPSLWQSFPWAIMAAAFLIAWYLLAPRPDDSYYAWMVLPMPVGATIMGPFFRRYGPGLPPPGARFGVRHLLLWITAAAVTLAVVQTTRSIQLKALENILVLGGDLLLLCCWIALEYCVAVPILVFMIRIRRFRRWFPWFVLGYFPVMLMIDAALMSMITSTPFVMDSEGLLYSFLQIALLVATLLAWRQSDWLPAAEPDTAVA